MEFIPTAPFSSVGLLSAGTRWPLRASAFNVPYKAGANPDYVAKFTDFSAFIRKGHLVAFFGTDDLVLPHRGTTSPTTP